MARAGDPDVIDPLELLRHQREAAALAALVAPTVPLGSVYSPVVNAYKRGGSQDYLDTFADTPVANPNSQRRGEQSRAPGYEAQAMDTQTPGAVQRSIFDQFKQGAYETQRRGERTPSAPIDDYSTETQRRLKAAGVDTSRLGAPGPKDTTYRSSTFGVAEGIGQGLEGAQTFAKAGAAIPSIIADRGVRTRFESLVKQIAAKTGRSEDDPFVRMAAGALVEDERPDAFKVPLRSLLPGPASLLFGGLVPDVAIGEKGLSEMLTDPFNIVGGAGFEKAVLSTLSKGARAVQGARGGLSVAALTARTGAEGVSERAAARAARTFSDADTPAARAAVAQQADEVAKRGVGRFASEQAGSARIDLGIPNMAEGAGRFLRSEEGGVLTQVAKATPQGNVGQVLQQAANTKKARLAGLVARLEQGGALTAKEEEELLTFLKGVGLGERDVTTGSVQSAANRIDELQQQRAAGGVVRTTEAPISALPANNERLGSMQVEKLGGPNAGQQVIMRSIHAGVESDVARRTSSISWANTEETARALHEPLSETVSRLIKHGETSRDVERVREEVVARVGTIQRVAEASKQGLATDADRLAAMQSLYEASLAWSPLQGAVSEAARTTALMRKSVAQAFADGPSAEAYKNALAALTKGADINDVFNALMKLDPTDTAALGGFLKDVMHVSGGKQWDEFYRANVLWGLQTHITNIVSGEYQKAVFLATRITANPRSAPGLLQGYAVGYRRAFDRIPNILREIDVPDKYGTILPGGAIRGDIEISAGPLRATIPHQVVNPLGRITRTPYTLLGLEDAFQTSPMLHARMRELAWDAARKDGIGIRDARHGQFVEEFLKNPPTTAKQIALHDSEEFALHGQGKVIESMLQMRRAAPWMRPFVMFVNTPTNLAKLGTRMSPLGLARAVPGMEKLLGFEKRTPLAQTIRESGIVGGATGAWMYSLLANGDMTGLYPKSRNEANEWAAEGKGPLMLRASEYPILGPAYRVIYGADAEKRWVTANMLGPLLMPALFAAAVNRAFDDNSDLPIEEQVQIGATAIGKTMLDQIPLFAGLRTLSDAAQTNPLEVAGDMISRLARPAIPMVTLLTMFERMSDDLKRRPQDILETIEASVPGLGINIPSEVDVLGRDMKNDAGFLALLPRSTIEQPHPVLDWTKKLRDSVPSFTGLPQVARDVEAGATGQDSDKFRLSRELYHDYQKLAGGYRDTDLTELTNSEAFLKQPPIEQARQFAATRDAADKRARAEIGMRVAREGTTPEDIAKGAAMAVYATTGNVARGALLEALQKEGRLSQEAINRINGNWGKIDAAAIHVGGNGQPEVTDGDTFVAALPDQTKNPVRLLRIDTPEKGQKGYEEAKAALGQFLAGKTLSIQYAKADAFGRLLSEVTADGINVSDWMVEQGYSEYRKPTKDDHMTVQEYLGVKQLKDEYEATPPLRDFAMQTITNRGFTWEQVQTAVQTFKEMVAAAKKRGVDEPATKDPEIARFRREQVGGALINYFGIDGDILPSQENQKRKDLRKHPLWGRVD